MLRYNMPVLYIKDYVEDHQSLHNNDKDKDKDCFLCSIDLDFVDGFDETHRLVNHSFPIFLSATKYHSDADYNSRLVGVVFVVVVVVVSWSVCHTDWPTRPCYLYPIPPIYFQPNHVYSIQLQIRLLGNPLLHIFHTGELHRSSRMGKKSDGH